MRSCARPLASFLFFYANLWLFPARPLHRLVALAHAQKLIKSFLAYPVVIYPCARAALIFTRPLLFCTAGANMALPFFNNPFSFFRVLFICLSYIYIRTYVRARPFPRTTNTILSNNHTYIYILAHARYPPRSVSLLVLKVLVHLYDGGSSHTERKENFSGGGMLTTLTTTPYAPARLSSLVLFSHVGRYACSCYI